MSLNSARSPHKMFYLDLPLCRLNVMRAGRGQPLIMVPATISRAENWQELVAFAAQWFEVYFFELPGHGESSTLRQSFHTALIGEVVEQLADRMGFQRFSLMGFSFGGILAMQAFLRLQQRIDRLMLIAPCLAGSAIQLSPARRTVILSMMELLKHAAIRNQVHHFLHDQPYNQYSAALLRRIGNVEETIPLDEVLRKVSPVTLEVLIAQIDETLKIDFPSPQEPFTTPCYFAMSVNDPLLDYKITADTLQRFFASPSIMELDYPFHQPPRPFTFDELNEGFSTTVESFLSAPWNGSQKVTTPAWMEKFQ